MLTSLNPPPPAPRYVVITPARSEAAGIRETIRSMAAQTFRPAQWIIVDDGSQDETGALLDLFANEYPWISVLHRLDRGFRSPGAGVIEAFSDGLRLLRCQNWEYIVKLDADLTLDSEYFERCLAHFEAEPALGIGGGTIYTAQDNEMEIERNPLFHVRGATKIYRRACWEAIGGLLAAPGWDTLDEVKANMLGWQTRTFPDIRLLQRRPTGSNDGAWRNHVKNGRANYISGYHPLFMLGKCLKRAVQTPRLIASLALAYGYLTGYFKRIPRVDDPALITYLRQQQLRRLLFQESIWK